MIRRARCGEARLYDARLWHPGSASTASCAWCAYRASP